MALSSLFDEKPNLGFSVSGPSVLLEKKLTGKGGEIAPKKQHVPRLVLSGSLATSLLAPAYRTLKE